MQRRTSILPLFLALAGCAGRDATPAGTGDAAGSLVRVDLSYTRVGGADELRYDAQAHFVRYRSLDATSVPTLLGLTDSDGLALDGCRVFDGTADLDEALAADGPTLGRSAAEVALLDAGRLEVRGPVDRASLRPTHYPELVPFVSGVVYGAEASQPLVLGAGQNYQVIGEGGEEVGPFMAQVTAPRSFPQVTAEPVRRGAELNVRWSAEPDNSENLLLEVKWSTRSDGAHAVRCRARDDGEFSMPHELLDGIPPAQTGITLTATRATRSSFWAPSLGRGELAFELREVVALQVNP